MKMEMDKVEKQLQNLINNQEIQLLKVARRLVPEITKEDLLQPFDYESLDKHPEFRYEEGVWHGLMMADMAIKSLKEEKDKKEG